MPTDGFLPTVRYKLWAAGGGGGGWDSHAGGEGAGGACVEGIINVNPGQLIEVYVGQGGGAGTGGGRAAGGYNGKSKTGYSGGRGGNSGPSGYSGSGGGGGGPTLMTLDSRIVAIAGAGGGGPGGGQSGASNASSALTLASKFYASAADQSKGVAGGDHGGDGGGGGGGGGGNAGGEGGAQGGGDVAGQPGNSGSNAQYYINPADVGVYQSGRAPGGYNFEDYPGNNVGFGGTATPGAVQPGGNGYAVLTFYRATGIFVKNNGAFTRVNHRMKTAGAYGRKINSWVNINGSWRPVNAGADILFNMDAVRWGDPGLARYIPPPPPPPPAVYYSSGGGGSSSWRGETSVTPATVISGGVNNMGSASSTTGFA